jgi:hypothetical protein
MNNSQNTKGEIMKVTCHLSNGKKVGNFSSPHEFTFEDGSILPAHTAEESERLKVTFNEVIDDDGDVTLSFDLSDEVWDEMYEWLEVWNDGLVDYVFVPLPMMTAIKQTWSEELVKHSPFRCIRIEDRVKKLASITKQCI